MSKLHIKKGDTAGAREGAARHRGGSQYGQQEPEAQRQVPSGRYC